MSNQYWVLPAQGFKYPDILLTILRELGPIQMLREKVRLTK